MKWNNARILDTSMPALVQCSVLVGRLDVCVLGLYCWEQLAQQHRLLNVCMICSRWALQSYQQNSAMA